MPIATVRPKLVKYIGMPSNKLRLPPSKLLGSYVTDPNQKIAKKNIFHSIYRNLFDYRYVSLDTRYYERVMDDLIYLYTQHHLSKKEGYVCLICHPKLVDNVRIDNIRSLISAINKHSDKFRIVTMRDIYNVIIQK